MSVHSKEEWNFIKNTIVSGVTGNIWIGGYQTKDENVWKWDDESPFDWSNWEADISFGFGFCAYLWQEELYVWQDAPCDSYSFSFVCKM